VKTGYILESNLQTLCCLGCLEKTGYKQKLSIKFEVQQTHAVGRGRAAPLMRTFHSQSVKPGLSPIISNFI
jgi:hypothetical protein